MGFKKYKDMKKGLMILTLAMLWLTGIAQIADVRVPFKAGLKYGVQNANEKEIIAPVYDDVAIDIELKLIMLKKEGLWGVFDWTGKMILDFIISAQGQGYAGRPEIKRVYNGNQEYKGKTGSGLLCVIDLFANVRYYINPNQLLPSYKAYGNKILQPDYNVQNLNYDVINNLFMISTRDQRVTFIDSTGTQYVNDSFEEGQLLSDRLFTGKKEGMFALYNGKKPMTTFRYDRRAYRHFDHAFYMSRKIKNAAQNPVTLYYIFNPRGEVVDSSESTPFIFNGGVLVNKGPGFIVYDAQFKTKFSHSEYTGDLVKIGARKYIITSSKGKQGVLTLDGEEKYPTTYNISKHDHFPSLTIFSEVKATLVDSMLVPYFEMDSVTSLSPTRLKDVYVFSKKKSWQDLFGLAAANKTIIEAPEWEQISLVECNDLAIMKRGREVVVKNISENKKVLALSNDWRLTVDCKRANIQAYDAKDTYMLFDFSGTLIDSFSQKQRLAAYNFGPNKYKSEKVNKKFKLVDQNGFEVLPGVYDRIEMVYDPASKESVYMCQTAQSTHPSAQVYNDQLKIITPAGYSMPFDWHRYMDENPGTLCVVNDADLAKNKVYFRMGICDYKGKWIVQPFYGTFKFIMPGLFMLHYYDERVVRVFDSRGNKTCAEDFFMVDRGRGSDFFQNRVLVGKLKDLNFIKQIDSLHLEKLSMELAVEKIKSLGEPAMLYGYLNKVGKIALGLKYAKAQPFSMSSITTTVAIERDGKQVSQVIDTSGNVIFEADFDEMEVIDSFYFKVKKNGRWALATSKGQVLTPFQFQELFFDSRSGFGTAADEGERFIISSDYKVLSLGKCYNALTEKINGYYVVKLIAQIPGSYSTKDKFAIYDQDLIKRAEVADAVEIDGEYNKLPLAPGYLVVFKEYGGKDFYLFDVMKNKVMERK